MSTHPDWIIPDWPAPKQVHAVCSTRAGGVSLPPYDSLNLGDHVGDLPADVAANRAIFSKSMRARPVFLSQVHGTHTKSISNFTPHGTEADACFAEQAGVACTIMVADCLPVLFTNVQGTQIAAAHAGWRSLAGQGGQGVLETVFKCFSPLAHVGCAQEAINVIAWLGPCIGPDTFEVGNDVREVFVAHDASAAQLFKALPGGKWLADLQGLARLRLHAMGVAQIYGNDGSNAWCTVSNPSRFFSHRRDRVSGRLAVSIWLD